MRGNLVLAVTAGLASVLPMALALGAPGGLFFSILAPLPLFMAGLGLGVREVIVAGGTATVLWGLLAGLGASVGIALAMIVPAAILCRQALLSRAAAAGGREWYPGGLLATWLTIFGGLWLAMSGFVVGGLQAPEGLSLLVQNEMTKTLQLAAPDVPQEMIDRMSSSVAPVALGLAVTSWMLLIALNGILAQGLLGRFGRQLRPSPDIAGLELPQWLGLALAVAALAAFFGSGDIGYLAQNLVFVLLVPFLFAGLGVIHLFVRRFAARTAILTAIYAVIVLFSWPLAAVALLGLIDQWTGLRQRFKPAGSDREDE